MTREARELNSGSQKYGPCEVCGNKVGTMFIANKSFDMHVFGHEECLKKHIPLMCYGKPIPVEVLVNIFFEDQVGEFTGIKTGEGHFNFGAGVFRSNDYWEQKINWWELAS